MSQNAQAANAIASRIASLFDGASVSIQAADGTVLGTSAFANPAYGSAGSTEPGLAEVNGLPLAIENSGEVGTAEKAVIECVVDGKTLRFEREVGTPGSGKEIILSSLAFDGVAARQITGMNLRVSGYASELDKAHSVEITSPLDGAAFTENQNVSIAFEVTEGDTAKASSALVQYENSEGGFQNIGTVPLSGSGSYSTSWTAVVGAQGIRVTIRDASSSTLAQDAIAVSVTAPENTAPVVTITNVTTTAGGGPVTITVTIVDNETPVTPTTSDAVMGEGIGEANTITDLGNGVYRFGWTNVPVGSYTVTVTVSDGQEEGSDTAVVEVGEVQPVSYPLDEFSDAIAAYSLRRLSQSYDGPAIRVRRSSDGQEQDIGFVGPDLDTASLLAFVGTGSGNVTRWYSQVPGVADLEHVQDPNVSEPQDPPLIVKDGALLTEKRTGKVRMLGQGGYWRTASDHAAPFPNEHTVWALAERRNRYTDFNLKPFFGPAGRPEGTSDRDLTHEHERIMVEWRNSRMAVNYDVTSDSGGTSTAFTKEWAYIGGRIKSGEQRWHIGPNGDGPGTSYERDFSSYSRSRLLAWAGEDIYVSEYVMWPHLTEAQYRQRFFAADSYWGSYVPEDEYSPNTIFPQNFWWQAKIYKWLKGNTVEDYTIETRVKSVNASTGTVVVGGADWSHLPSGHQIGIHDKTFDLAAPPTFDGTDTTLELVGDLSSVEVGQQVTFKLYWDGTYSDIDELARLWTMFEQDGDSRREFEINGRALPYWYVLNDGEGHGIEASGAPRIPDVYDGPYNYGMGMSVAFWAVQDVPTASGKSGNPFYGSRAIALRALTVEAVNMLQIVKAGGHYTSSAYIGGWHWSWAETLHQVGHYLDADTKAAMLAACMHMIERSHEIGEYSANANLGVKQVEACGAVAAHFPPGSEEDVRCQEAAKRVMFMDASGTVDTESSTWHKEGNFYEGRTPEGSYNNRSLTHVAGARYYTEGRPGWEFLDDVLERGLAFGRYQVAADVDEHGYDATGWSGRVADGVTGGQWSGWGQRYLAYKYKDARIHLIRWAAGFVPRLPLDEQALLSDTKSRIDNHRILTVMTEDPPYWLPRSTWPAEVPYAPRQAGWYEELRAYLTSDSDDLYPFLHPQSEKPNYAQPLPPDPGEEDWLFFKGGEAGTTRFGGHVHVPRVVGAYGGTQGPVFHEFWSESYGVLLASLRYNNAGGAFPWATPHDWPYERVWGLGDTASEIFTWALYNPNDVVHESVTYDEDGKWIEHVMKLDPTTNEGRLHAIAADALWKQTKRFTIVDEPGVDTGMRVDLALDYTKGAGSHDQITALAWTLPILGVKPGFQTLVGLFFHVWDGEAWASILPGTSATGQVFRITREVGSQGPRQIWIKLGSARRVTVHPIHTAPSGHRTFASFEINLHPTGDGSAVDVPALVEESLLITTTDPGLTPTVIGSSIVYPQPTDPQPVGGHWAIQTTHEVPDGMTLEEVHYEYTTDGETWHAIASYVEGGSSSAITKNDDGTFQYVSLTDTGHDVIPEGLQKLRVRAVNQLGGENSSEIDLVSRVPVLEVQESFERPDGTLLIKDLALESGGVIGGDNSDAECRGGRMMRPAGSPYNPWGYSWWTLLSSEHCIVRAVFNRGTASMVDTTSAGNAIMFRNQGSYYLTSRLKMVYSGSGAKGIRMDGIGSPDTDTAPHDLAVNTDYVVEVQASGRSAIGSLYDATGTTLLARVWRLGVSRYGSGNRYVGLSLIDEGLSWDDFKAFVIP